MIISVGGGGRYDCGVKLRVQIFLRCNLCTFPIAGGKHGNVNVYVGTYAHSQALEAESSIWTS